jgi:transposase-like protein
MKTKSFVLKLNQITTALLSMTPALREAVHQSIRTSQVEMPINELFQPIFDASPSCTYCAHCASAHLKKWGKSGETQRYRCNHCAKTFNIKIKTPLARLRKCHLWGEYARYIVIN